MNNKIFMTNIANQKRNNTEENEFETVQLPAPDILRIRFEKSQVSKSKFLATKLSRNTWLSTSLDFRLF